jgi:hypothetical protein
LKSNHLLLPISVKGNNIFPFSAIAVGGLQRSTVTRIAQYVFPVSALILILSCGRWVCRILQRAQHNSLMAATSDESSSLLLALPRDVVLEVCQLPYKFSNNVGRITYQCRALTWITGIPGPSKNSIYSLDFPWILYSRQAFSVGSCQIPLKLAVARYLKNWDCETY